MMMIQQRSCNIGNNQVAMFFPITGYIKTRTYGSVI